ncbi:hypothetical protein PTE30175_02628 [Pandoraea terrae]|uniref:Uncharacterized protein n=1 Tax=Pandoraea terrae TaxID=1537710 RepID=A0A5E4VMU8_9BURK|nr:hypothetical protein PTE30175_02628 [Pandoraea terrae]
MVAFAATAAANAGCGKRDVAARRSRLTGMRVKMPARRHRNALIEA